MSFIAVRGASEHNLKGIDVDLPRGELIVLSGVSGSGKSSLAYDTIYREAQRRYLETFSSYARQFLGRMSRPAVSGIEGLSPAIAVDQRSTLRHPRSTVGTLSGLHDDLRLLFARLGSAPPGTVLERRLFSFNSVHGACPSCRGLGVEDRLDPALLVADPSRTIRQGALTITTPTGYVIYSQVTIDVLDQVCRAHGFDVDTPWSALTDEQRRVVLYGSDRIRIPYGKHPLASRLRWSGITAKPREEGVYKGILPVMEQILQRSRNRNILRFVRSLPCAACGGSRLRPEALAVRFRDADIAALSRLAIEEVAGFFQRLQFLPAESPVGEPLRAEVLKRARLLQQLGLGHLALDRGSASLSGGEAQRLRLASQLGSGLHGVLYVLDEPSIGLHPSEHARLLGVLRDLRDRGNTVLLVEHDEETIRAADWLVDIGPGPGQHGGELLFSGRVSDLVATASPGRDQGEGGPLRSRTAAFLTGGETAPRPASRRRGEGVIRLRDAARHNLQRLDVAFLARAFNVVTGVSGAGKSSLVEELIDRAGRGALEAEPPVARLIAVDQSPLGRTPRSNPATYTGLSDVVRDLLAATPEAAARGFAKARFSFNVPGGRCEACGGAGVQQVGMHFLGQVDVVCDACGGRRFNDETLGIRYNGRTIHDLLETTIEDAQGALAAAPRARRILSVLNGLGLGYLKLGQPSTTLSGGEAQRVKLAFELSRAARGHTLYVLDEPTAGLHSADVAVLLSALDALVGQGHSVITIEHNLDVVRAADRVIDLGPGGGRHGGRLVAIGTPEEIAGCEASVTGAVLRGAPAGDRAPGEAAPAGPGLAARAAGTAPITFSGVRTHNLKGIDVSIPAGQLTVVTGVSGSGKSSLAFDTIFAEARNRFVESFSAYARRFLEKPGDAEFDGVSGLRPAVAIRQGRPSRNPRSTVGTMTEIADYYRLMFARIGRRDDGGVVAGGQWLVAGRQESADGNSNLLAVRARPLPAHQRDRLATSHQPPATVLTASMFSPNTEQGACTACKGLGTTVECDPARLVTDPSRPLGDGAMDGHKTGRFYGDPFGQHVATLRAAGRARGVDFSVPWADLPPGARDLAMRGAGDEEFDVEWSYRRGSRSGVHRFTSRWPGFAVLVELEYARKHADRRGEAVEPLMRRVKCRACGGTRLRPEHLAVRVAGRHIAGWLALTVTDSRRLLEAIGEDPESAGLAARDALVSADLREEVRRRLVRLEEAGVGYLSLDREASTLSAGEAQRVRLASEVGGGLTGMAYVLDEPTAGLHPRDTARLLALLRGLRDAGNAVVVVEHDPDVIRAADHVLDLGPGAGDRGGRVVAAGAPEAVVRALESATGRYLREGPLPVRGSATRPLGPGLRVRQARCHNLRGLDVDVPAGGLVSVTGVSGSGKSTLVFDVIAPAVARILEGRVTREVELLAPFVRVVSSSGELPSGAAGGMTATLAGVFDRLRDLFAGTTAARERQLGRKHFSLAVKGGRCEACEGLGRTRVSMDFLPDAWVPCEECGGRRYGPEALACRLDGRSIADVLDLTAAEVLAAFAREPAIASRLRVLEDLGLGYLRLGQASRTLSGGERQRLALAAELMREGGGPTLFLFDEPTAGLHVDDVARLLQVMDRLVRTGHTVVVVEHHLDVIASSDWVIDLGPEGGDGGGRLVAQGTPGQLAREAASWTGRALARSEPS